MKIGMVGVGAIGGLIGGLLAENGNDVTFVDPWQDHVDAINENGLYMEVSGEEDSGRYVPVTKATTDPKEAGVMDAIIFLVKGSKTLDTIEEIKPMIGDDTIVVTLQNGIGNPEKIASVIGEDNVGYGVIEFSSVLMGPGKIRYELADGIIFGKQLSDNENPNFTELVERFNKSEMDFRVTDEADEKIWSKLVINGNYNVLCGITGIKMGELLGTEEGKDLMANITKEIVDIANAKNIPLDYEAELHHLEDLGTKVANHYPSLAQDVARQVVTEVVSINGAIVEEGKRVGVAAPYNEAVYKIMRVIEQNYDVGKEFNIN